MSSSGRGTRKAARSNPLNRNLVSQDTADPSNTGLRHTAEKYARMIQSTPDAITLRSLPERRYVEVNDGFTRLTGYSMAEVLGKTPGELGIWVEQQPHEENLRALTESGQVRQEEFRFRTKSGEIRHGQVSAVQLTLDGEPMVLSITHDITGLKHTEQALRRSEADFRSLVQKSPYGIYRIDQAGRLSLGNPALARMLGYDGEAVLLNELSLCKDSTELSLSRQLLQENWLRNDFEPVESAWKRKDGKWLTVRLSARPVQKNGGPEWAYLEVFAEDVTERRNLERQVLQTQKMDAIGRLAGGLAHDFNNLLAVILGHSELLAEQVDRGTKLQNSAEAIRKAAERGASLTMQLLAFSRKQLVEPRVLDINGALIEMEKLARRVISEDIELLVRPGQNLGRIRIDPGQFDQVTMNLIVNARDAMPAGGKIVLETANADLDESYTRQHIGIVPGPYVMLAVSDTGIGMDAPTLARIFEPFFSTKDKGKGTGLGLSTVYGIVKQAGGHIFPYSEPGAGTTMRLYFPHVEASAEPESAAPKIQLARGTETILVVEDEAPLRDLTRDILADAGYRVLDAASVEEASQLATAHRDGIALLLTDVVMPGRNGRELAEQLKSADAGLKVLFMSGYSGEVIAHRGVLEGASAVIQKPFSKKALLARVRELLDSR
ncbi:MAG TPA: PAS domain S-box protein [Candidatus Acidoferrum sp.]|nr:PAS domain S-box protein [Candidatus Acidoferrum sp.]